MAEKIGTSKISKDPKVTIPKKVREILDLKENDYLVFYLDDDGRVYVRKGRLVVEEPQNNDQDSGG